METTIPGIEIPIIKIQWSCDFEAITKMIYQQSIFFFLCLCSQHFPSLDSPDDLSVHTKYISHNMLIFREETHVTVLLLLMKYSNKIFIVGQFHKHIS